MRIGIVTDSPFDSPLGYSIRPKELASNLSKLDCEVHIFSPVDKSHKISDNLIVHGIGGCQTIFTTRLYRYVRKVFKSPLTARYLYQKNVLEKLSERLAASIHASVKRCDIEVLQGEKEIAGMAAEVVGRRLDIPVVVDIHGLLAEEAVQCGLLKSDSRESLGCSAFVSEVLRKSDAVVAVSEGLKSYLGQRFEIKNDQVFVVPNAGTFKRITRSLRPTPKRIVYAGIFEPWERVDLAISSVPHVLKLHKSAKFFFAGAGSLKPALIKLRKRLRVKECVKFSGLISYDDIATFLSQGDVAILPSTVDIVRKVACPIKLFDYLATGLPIITVKGLWWSDFVLQNDVGLVADADPASFAESINDLLSSPEKINSMSENAVKLVKEKYNWTEMARTLLGIYKRIV